MSFIALLTMVWKISQRLSVRDKDSVDVNTIMKVREETLREISIRDQQILDLATKTLMAMNKSTNMMEKLVDRIDELQDIIKDCPGIKPNVEEK
jgi:methyl-accepting chemotaxis protein